MLYVINISIKLEEGERWARTSVKVKLEKEGVDRKVTESLDYGENYQESLRLFDNFTDHPTVDRNW